MLNIELVASKILYYSAFPILAYATFGFIPATTKNAPITILNTASPPLDNPSHNPSPIRSPKSPIPEISKPKPAANATARMKMRIAFLTFSEDKPFHRCLCFSSGAFNINPSQNAPIHACLGVVSLFIFDLGCTAPWNT